MVDLTETVSPTDFQLFIGFFVIAILAMAFFTLITQRNSIKMVIGTEMLSKSVLLYLISTGFLQVRMNGINGIGMAEAMVVMIVVIEAVVTAVALSLIVKAHGHTLSVDLSTLRRLWG